MKYEQAQGSYLEKNKAHKKTKKEKPKTKLSHKSKRKKFDDEDWSDE